MAALAPGKRSLGSFDSDDDVEDMLDDPFLEWENMRRTERYAELRQSQKPAGPKRSVSSSQAGPPKKKNKGTQRGTYASRSVSQPSSFVYSASTSPAWSSSGIQSSAASTSFSRPLSYGNTPRSSLGSQVPSTSKFDDEFEDDIEVIDLTGSDALPDFELYGKMDAVIVGVRYYAGYATPGEAVACRREPSNPYDSNAIRVNNVMGTQIGHMPRKVAEKLAAYMDRDEIRVEAIITGEKGQFDCPIRLSLFGTSDRVGRLALEKKLKDDKLLKATELKNTRLENEATRLAALGLQTNRSSAGLGTKGKNTVPEISVEDLRNASQAVDFRPGTDSIKALAMGEKEMSQMPMAMQPDALRAKLLPYQLQGLAWLLEKESPSFSHTHKAGEILQLWRREARGGYYNVAANHRTSNPPQLMSGGILADDMGLGKTLQVISLILAGTGTGPTLIVAPLSVMSNWEQQIERHVKKERKLKVLRWHGADTKNIPAKTLAKYDVVITSYNKMAQEIGPNVEHQCLRAQKWRRIVLDEGHTIRNPRSKAAEAACMLKADSRWVLSGTPIVNSVKDLQSLLRFLHITGGIEDPSIFAAVISRPLARGERAAEGLLQSLMRDICLRRKKDMSFVDLKLPPKSEYIHKITFREEEKMKYNALLSEAQHELARYRKEGKGNFSHVLERLLRLRQTCNHWTLCRQRMEDLLKLLGDKAVVPLNAENRRILQQALQLYIESREDCAVCMDTLASPVITHCKHVFCRPCIEKVIDIQHKCPMCRNELKADGLLEPAPETSGDEVEDFDSDEKSSKTEALLHILRATLKDPASKVIIFSQWTSFLNIIQRQVAEAGYQFTRIDGSMRPNQRDAALDALDHDPETRIMLASLSVCSVGLNLVAADTVILADSWWAPAIEDQAVDRVHRLGQTRKTTIWRLIVEGTVEERVLDIQAEKRQLVSKAFQEKEKGKKTKETRMSDILKLLA